MIPFNFFLLLGGIGSSELALLIFIVLFIFVMRWLGAWMLRINEVIDLLKEIRDNTKRQG